MNQDDILIAKVRDSATIPSKRDGDAGFDIYANFEAPHMFFAPHETRMVPTGIMTAFSNRYVMILKERGSTGTKGIGQRCGVVDASYRGEIFVPLTNHNDKPLLIMKDDRESVLDALSDDYVVYPYKKAICQAIIVPVPDVHVVEASKEEVLSVSSDRGSGCLGSSGK